MEGERGGTLPLDEPCVKWPPVSELRYGGRWPLCECVGLLIRLGPMQIFYSRRRRGRGRERGEVEGVLREGREEREGREGERQR